jgi:hypothetical protein
VEDNNLRNFLNGLSREDHNLNLHCCEKLNSHISACSFSALPLTVAHCNIKVELILLKHLYVETDLIQVSVLIRLSPS